VSKIEILPEVTCGRYDCEAVSVRDATLELLAFLFTLEYHSHFAEWQSKHAMFGR
jgi:hypothetical protein